MLVAGECRARSTDGRGVGVGQPGACPIRARCGQEGAAEALFSWRVKRSLPAAPGQPLRVVWINPIPKLSVHTCEDCYVTSKEVRPCPECGHVPQVHPKPGDRDLSICAACIYEEDEGLRDVEGHVHEGLRGVAGG